MRTVKDGAWLRKWREKNDLTLKEAGERFGFNWISWWRFENGKRTISPRIFAMIVEIENKPEGAGTAKNRPPRNRRKA